MPIDIRGLDKAELLAGLFNASKPQGLGFLAQGRNSEMTVDDAREVLRTAGNRPYFDYLRGRVMKVDLSGDSLEPRMYDRDNDEGAALRVVETIRARLAVQFRVGMPTNVTEALANAGMAQGAVNSIHIQITGMRK